MSDELMFVKKSSLESVADHIRAKAGTDEKMVFPEEWESTIDAIPSGGDTSIEDGLIQGTLSGDYYNDRVTVVKGSAFTGNKDLKSITLPNVTTLNKGAEMNNCTNLEEVTFENLTTFNTSNCFNSDINLKVVNFPKVTTLTGTTSFQGCKALTTLNAPLLTALNINYGFRNCTSITKVTTEYTPLLKIISQNTFNETTNLTLVDLPLTNIGTMAFYKSSLTTLILRNNGTSKLCVLSNANAFGETPIANGEGYIYITRDNVDELKGMTNWVTYANQIRAIEDWENILEITSQPTDITAVVDTEVTFSVKADGIISDYRWQTSKDGGVTWGDNSGTLPNYSTTAKEKYNGYMVRCILKNINGQEIISDTATLTVTAT